MSSDIMRRHIEQMAQIGRESIEKTKENMELQAKVLRRQLHPLAKLIIPESEGEPPEKQGEMIS